MSRELGDQPDPLILRRFWAVVSRRPSARRAHGLVIVVATTLALGGGCDDSGEAGSGAVAGMWAPSQPHDGSTSLSNSSNSANSADVRDVQSPPVPVIPAPMSLGLAPPGVTTGATVVLDEASGTTLFSHNPRTRLSPASLTKVATAVVVLEQGRIEERITVHPEIGRYWLEDSSAMGLLPGDTLSIRDLLYGMLMVSGNDAADALALATAGSNHAFVERMNALASRLDLRDTHFTDAAGLGGPEHYSSAQDLAVLSRYAMTFPAFREIVGTEEYVVKANRDFPLYNLNPLLNYTPGVDGIKTGFTETAGKTFSLSATRDGHRVYIVMLDAPLRAQDAIALLEWAFANHQWPPGRLIRE